MVNPTKQLLNTMTGTKYEPKSPIASGMFIPNKSGGFSQSLLLDDGSVSLPGLAFENDRNTGIYRIGDDNLGIAIGGTKIIDVDSTDVLFSGDITVNATEQVNLDGGNGTYIKESADNTIALVCNNTEEMTIGSASITIGSNPVRTGHAGSAATPSYSWTSGIGNDNGIYGITTDNWACSAGGEKVLEFVSTGTKTFGQADINYSNDSGGDTYVSVKSIQESLTITAGTGAAGVTTSGSLAPAGSLIIGATVRVTTAPGGGATSFDLGVTGGDLDGLIDGLSTALSTTGDTLANGATDAVVPLRNISATTLTLTTNANVTGASMVVRITVHYLDLTPPSA